MKNSKVVKAPMGTKGVLPSYGDGLACPHCCDESIVRGTNEQGDPCWIAHEWEPSPGVSPPGVEIMFCPFCGFGLSDTVVSHSEEKAVTKKLTAGLAPLVLHLLPEEWAIQELVGLPPEKQPVLRIVIEQGNPPEIADTYITFRKGKPIELREKKR